MGTDFSKPESDGSWNVRCVVEGTGGTFQYGKTVAEGSRCRIDHASVHKIERNAHIGTQNCTNGVGVYFAIGPEHCFCANINASVNGLAAPGVKEFQEISEQIKAELQVISDTQKWRVSEVQKVSLILVCTNPEFGGYAVVDGILDFLDLKGHPRGVVNQNAHGFVTEPYRPGSHNKWFPSFLLYDREAENSNEARKQLDGYNMRELKDLEPREWIYICNRGWSAPKRAIGHN